MNRFEMTALVFLLSGIAGLAIFGWEMSHQPPNCEGGCTASFAEGHIDNGFGKPGTQVTFDRWTMPNLAKGWKMVNCCQNGKCWKPRADGMCYAVDAGAR